MSLVTEVLHKCNKYNLLSTCVTECTERQGTANTASGDIVDEAGLNRADTADFSGCSSGTVFAFKPLFTSNPPYFSQ